MVLGATPSSLPVRRRAAPLTLRIPLKRGVISVQTGRDVHRLAIHQRID